MIKKGKRLGDISLVARGSEAILISNACGPLINAICKEGDETYAARALG